MNDITLIMATYLNRGMLELQYDHLRSLPRDLKGHLTLIVVDDGSPDPARAPGEPLGFDFQLYRITEDHRWNQDAARNLGADHATTPWLLFTDMDHMIPETTMRRLIRGKLNPRNIYRFSRVSAPDMTPYHPHPNSWCMTREVWDRIGGYDERYAGLYGSDAPFRDSAKAAIAGRGDMILLGDALVRVGREVVADASTTTYARKTDEDRLGMQRVRAQIAALPAEERRPQRQGFPWVRVA